MLSGALGTLSLLCSLTTTSTTFAASPVATSHATTSAAAPDFVVATAYGWHPFRELHPNAPIVLVFAPDEATLATLEQELPALRARGVEIAAVTRDPDGTNWDRLEHLGLTYALWSDPQGRVAELFGITNAAAEPKTAAWCLIDGQDRIIDRQRGVDAAQLVGAVVRALPTSEVAGSDESR